MEQSIAEWKEYLQRVFETRVTFGEQFMTEDTEIVDYVKYLRFKEKSRVVYCAKGPHRKIRDLLVRFLMKLSQAECYSWATIYSAVHILDRFMDNHTVNRRQLHLVTLACLVIAGKVEERDSRTPRVSRLSRLIPKETEFNPRLYIEIEFYIIRYFRWNVIFITPYTFLECFILYSLDGTAQNSWPSVDENLNHDNSASLPATATQDLGFKIREYSFAILENVLKGEPRDQYAPSCIAASILQYARRKYGFNFWTQRLNNVTGCSHMEVVNCLANYIDLIVPYDFVEGPLYEPYFADERSPCCAKCCGSASYASLTEQISECSFSPEK